MTLKIVTKNPKETEKLGRIIGTLVPHGTIILLKGSLGCGKTCLTKGIGEGLGIDKNEIASPSFTLIHEYENLIHMDLYRIKQEEELEALGIEEYLSEPDKIKVIEWPELLESEIEGISFPTVEIICKEEDSKRIFEIKANKEILEKLKTFLTEE